MMADPVIRVYWDACAWIGLINNEKDKRTPLRVIWERAKKGEFRILTSTYSYMEVIYGVNVLGQPYPPEVSDAQVFAMLDAPYVERVQLDTEVAKFARMLKRKHHPTLGKRADAVHLASACYHNVEELHTYDGSHLLPLDGLTFCRNGSALVIRAPGPEAHGPLFAERHDDSKADSAGKPNGPTPPL